MTEGKRKVIIGAQPAKVFCRIKGCGEEASVSTFCVRHWAMVPEPLKGKMEVGRKLYEPYRNILGVRKAGGEALSEAAAEAAARIEKAEADETDG